MCNGLVHILIRPMVCILQKCIDQNSITYVSMSLSRGSADPRRVLFASAVTVLGVDPALEQSPDQMPVDRPDIRIHDPVCPDIPEEDDMDVSVEVPDVAAPVFQPPPGFERFSWPKDEWGPGSDPSLFDFSVELPGWFPWRYIGQSADPPSLPILSVTPDDSVVANVGSSRDEPDTPSGTDYLPDPVVESSLSGTDTLPDILVVSPPQRYPDLYRGRLLRLSPTFWTI